MSKSTSVKMTLATALLGAVALSALPASATEEMAMQKCYGIAKAGENGCASARGTHSCAGHATTDYDGGDWKMVPEGKCEEMHGKPEAFDGMNEAMKEMAH